MDRAPRPHVIALEPPRGLLDRCLSPLGHRLRAPDGIPTQAREAHSCRLQAVIGQVTDGRGRAEPLPAIARAAGALATDEALLYAPPGGRGDLIAAWAERQAAEAPGLGTATPVVVSGLSQGLSLAADLFCDPDTDVLLPDLAWDNYPNLFTLRSGARLVQYNLLDGDRLDLGALERALRGARTKAVVVLNFPHNPTGYVPTGAEARALVETLNRAPVPVVAIVDDAYLGFVYTADRPERSLYWDLVERADPDRVLALRVDGATKTLGFFGGRMGFLTHALRGAEADRLRGKLLHLLCATTLTAPSLSQCILRDALADEHLESDRRAMVARLGRRFRGLREALARHTTEWTSVLPGHGGAFVTVALHPDLSAEAVRRRLLETYDVGVVALPEANAIRIAFCSATEPDLEAIARHLESAVRDLAAVSVAC